MAIITSKITTVLVSVALGAAIGITGSQMVLSRHEPAYLKYPERLGDVVAALFVMGTYTWDALPVAGDQKSKWGWQEVIGVAKPRSAASWLDVFEEHPEFFRPVGDKKWSLVWRRARDSAWDTKTASKISQEELSHWSQDDKDRRLAREPLTPDQTTKLIEIAVDMQTRAIARREESRWWVPVLVGVICVFIGARLKS